MPPEKLDEDDHARLGELLRYYRDKNVAQRGERATRGEGATRAAMFCRLDSFPEHKKAVDELWTAGRKRTLLLMLEALHRFETHSAAHGGEPPSADYFGRPRVDGAHGSEVDVREVVVIDDDDGGASAAPETAAKVLTTQVAALTAQLAEANAAAQAARAAAAAAQSAAERVAAEKAALEAALVSEAARHKQTAALLSAKQLDNEAMSAKLEAAAAREARLRAQHTLTQEDESVAAAALRESGVDAAEQMVVEPVSKRHCAERLGGNGEVGANRPLTLGYVGHGPHWRAAKADEDKWGLVLTAALLVTWIAMRADMSRTTRNCLLELLVQQGACTRHPRDKTVGGIWAVLHAAQEHPVMAAALLGPGLWPAGASRNTVADALAAQLASADGGHAARTAVLERWLAAGCTSIMQLHEELGLLKADLYVRGVFNGTAPRYYRPEGGYARAAKAALEVQRSASRLFVAVLAPQAAATEAQAGPPGGGGVGARWDGAAVLPADGADVPPADGAAVPPADGADALQAGIAPGSDSDWADSEPSAEWSEESGSDAYEPEDERDRRRRSRALLQPPRKVRTDAALDVRVLQGLGHAAAVALAASAPPRNAGPPQRLPLRMDVEESHDAAIVSALKKAYDAALGAASGGGRAAVATAERSLAKRPRPAEGVQR